MYWADDGEVLWISQMLVNKECCKYRVFFQLMESLKGFNQDAKIVACATANTNITMQKILKFYGAEIIDMKFYANDHFYYPWNINKRAKLKAFLLHYKFLPGDLKKISDFCRGWKTLEQFTRI